MFYVFDLDGTLADASHRVHLIQTTPKRWEEFIELSLLDDPIHSIIELMHAVLDRNHRVEIWTARNESTRMQTVAWLRKHGAPNVPMRMRSKGDRREDFEVKQKFFDYGIPDLVFEDRRQLVDMYRARGIRVAHVAEGDY